MAGVIILYYVSVAPDGHWPDRINVSSECQVKKLQFKKYQEGRKVPTERTVLFSKTIREGLN